MEKWLKDVKERAKWEADWILKNIERTAAEQQVDSDWYFSEVLKNIRIMRGNKE